MSRSLPTKPPVLALAAAALVALCACGDTAERDDDSGIRIDAGREDAGDAGRDRDDGSVRADTGTTTDAGGSGAECSGYVPPPPGATPCRTTESCPAGTFGPVSCVPTDYVPPPVCGGEAPPPSCTTDADCAAFGGGLFVRCGLNPRPGCGGPRACAPACSSDPECDPGERCLATGLCEALRCPDAYACEADQRCDASATTADAHGCEAIPCSEGFACPTGWVCDSMPDPHIVPDAHGCRPMDCGETGTCPTNARCEATPAGYMCLRIGCDRDDECDCGACVAHNCVAGPGYCYEQPPPPP